MKRSRQQLQVTTGSLGKRRSCKIGKYAIIVAALLGSSCSVLALDDGRFANDPLKNWFDNLSSENRHGMRILCCETQRRERKLSELRGIVTLTGIGRAGDERFDQLARTG